MLLDALLSFNSALGVPQAVTATANSAGVIDVTGAGVGNLPRMVGGYPNLNTALGVDYGIGDGLAVPYVVVSVTTAGTGTGTVQISLQEAPDNGAGSPGAYVTIFSTAAMVGTTLVVPTLIVFPVPPSPIGVTSPRFYQLAYTVAGTATVSLTAAMTINPEFSLKGIQFPSNYLAA